MFYVDNTRPFLLKTLCYCYTLHVTHWRINNNTHVFVTYMCNCLYILMSFVSAKLLSGPVAKKTWKALCFVHHKHRRLRLTTTNGASWHEPSTVIIPSSKMVGDLSRHRALPATTTLNRTVSFRKLREYPHPLPPPLKGRWFRWRREGRVLQGRCWSYLVVVIILA